MLHLRKENGRFGINLNVMINVLMYEEGDLKAALQEAGISDANIIKKIITGGVAFDGDKNVLFELSPKDISEDSKQRIEITRSSTNMHKLIIKDKTKGAAPLLQYLVAGKVPPRNSA